jgi:phospholipid transport system substrate-binding protein
MESCTSIYRNKEHGILLDMIKFLSTKHLTKPAVIGVTLLALAGASTPAFSTSIKPTLAYTLSSYTLIASDPDEDKAISFITNASAQGLGFLSSDSLTDAQKKSEFRKFLKNNFDIRAIGRFALGRYWRTTTPAEKEEYQGLFEDMIVGVYSSRFSEYSGQNIEILDAEKRGKSDIVVHSKITGEGGPEIKLDWRVRQKNGRFRVIDIMVEGVSMAVTQRSDFASVIQRGGGDIDVLLAHLSNQ